MAITFGPHRKKEKKLALITIAILIAGGAVLIGMKLVQETKILPAVEIKKPRTPEISLEFLKDPRLKKLESLPDTPKFEGVPGRDNPFLPY
jgi:hypothetical protein